MQLDATEESSVSSMLYAVPWRYFSGLASCQRQIFPIFSPIYLLHSSMQIIPPTQPSTLPHKRPSPTWYLALEAQHWEAHKPGSFCSLKRRETPVHFHFSRDWMSRLLLFLWPPAFGILLPIHTSTRAWARDVNEVRIQVCQFSSSLDTAW